MKTEKTSTEEHVVSRVVPHSPLPWLQSHRCGADGNYRTQVYDEHGGTIATMDWYPMPMGNGVTATSRESNARLIVTAVNSHADLLEACKEALLWYGPDGDHIGEPWRSLLIAAVAKAEGR